eukprot:TRINITY_DN21582_c0_g1_i1.p1 TRINITY_DN21582_c0_g1~~TRINITY_DN21582_c0_g1_i1.p1  ORF type:complete len:214 (+),score=25.57 TRINITY_DN21582_c0_g1_i1:44-643(+)
MCIRDRHYTCPAFLNVKQLDVDHQDSISVPFLRSLYRLFSLDSWKNLLKAKGIEKENCFYSYTISTLLGYMDTLSRDAWDKTNEKLETKKLKKGMSEWKNEVEIIKNTNEVGIELDYKRLNETEIERYNQDEELKEVRRLCSSEEARKALTDLEHDETRPICNSKLKLRSWQILYQKDFTIFPPRTVDQRKRQSMAKLP